jgi:hypothetical protein
MVTARELVESIDRRYHHNWANDVEYLTKNHLVSEKNVQSPSTLHLRIYVGKPSSNGNPRFPNWRRNIQRPGGHIGKSIIKSLL